RVVDVRMWIARPHREGVCRLRNSPSRDVGGVDERPTCRGVVIPPPELVVDHSPIRYSSAGRVRGMTDGTEGSVGVAEDVAGDAAASNGREKPSELARPVERVGARRKRTSGDRGTGDRPSGSRVFEGIEDVHTGALPRSGELRDGEERLPLI